MVNQIFIACLKSNILRRLNLSARQTSLWNVIYDGQKSEGFFSGWPPSKSAIKASLDAIQSCTGLDVVQPEGCSKFLVETASRACEKVRDIQEWYTEWRSRTLEAMGPLLGRLLVLLDLYYFFSLCLSATAHSFVLLSVLILFLACFPDFQPLPWVLWCMYTGIVLLHVCEYVLGVVFAHAWLVLNILKWFMLLIFVWLGPLVASLAVLSRQGFLWLQRDRQFFSLKLSLDSKGNPDIRCTVTADHDNCQLFEKPQSNCA